MKNASSCLALHCRLGGIGIIDPTTVSNNQYSNSEKITEPLVALILQQKQICPTDTWTEMERIKVDVKKDLSESLKRRVELAKEKGASVWLMALPLDMNGFALHKSAFRDALCL